MRLDRGWVVALKEMAEFKSNKYILFTLIFIPILMAVVLPIGIFGTILSVVNPTQEPLDLDPVIVDTIDSQTITGQVLSNVTITGSVIQSSVVKDSEVVDSTLIGVVVEDSILERVTLRRSVVRHSNVINATSVEASSLVGSPVIGSDESLAMNLDVLLNFFLLFFILIPAAIPAVIASYSFVGEKVSRSLEPLLATPATDGELLLGKSLSIFVPTTGVTWLAAILFIAIMDIQLAPYYGYPPLPNPQWIVALLLLVPLFAVLSITTNVIISSKVSDVRASQQLGTLVILPVLVLFMTSAFGVVSLGMVEMLMFSGLLVAIDVAVGYLALKTFRREEILVKWK